MTAEIISVGTELLMGQILNTNAKYIAQRLTEFGISHFFEMTVGDNPARLKSAIQEAADRSDIVFLTGGLGPTSDDITKEIAAEIWGLELTEHKPSLEAMELRFRSMGRKMTPNNYKQAAFPKEANVLPNPNGTAPGCIFEKNDKALILLPGPPHEMEPMFEASVIPYLEQKSSVKFYSKVIRICGMGESAVEYELKDLISAQQNPTIAPYASMGEVTLRITAMCKSDEEGLRLVTPIIEEISRRLGDCIYTTDGDPLEAVCAKLLKENALTIAVAESCTGGRLCSSLVNVAGASNWLLEGIIAYSEAAKIRDLNVPEKMLNEFGAVSSEVALAMARGMRERASSDVAVSTTGFAGPGSGPEAGLVYIGYSSKTLERAYEFNFSGGRERVRTLAAINALNILRKNLE